MLTPYVSSHEYVALAVPLFIVLAVLAAVTFVDLRTVNVVRRVVRRVWCPVRGQRVTVELEEELWGGKRLDVLQCAAFDPAGEVECEKVCLRPGRWLRHAGQVSAVGGGAP